MILFTCDRCGNKSKGRNSGYVTFEAYGLEKVKTFDLCPACYLDFVELFIEGKAEKPKPAASPKKRTKVDAGKIRALADAGWTVKQIREELGCSDQTVRNHLEVAKNEQAD